MIVAFMFIFGCLCSSYINELLARQSYALKERGEKSTMIILSLGSKKIHAMNWAKRFGRIEDGIPTEKAQARAVTEWWRRSTTVRQLVWKLRSRWRHAMRSSRRNGMRFGYDPKSYSQNFDDGVLRDYLAPCALG